MNSIKDFFQSIFDSYTERIKSPLIGSFILSFAIFNWRPLCILFFSNWQIHSKIEWIDKKYCKEEAIYWPLAIALFYIVILPYINLFFEWILQKYNNQNATKKNKLRIQSLTQQRKEAALRREIADAEAGTSEINNLKSRNDSLLKEIENFADQNKNDVSRLNTTIENLKKSEESLQFEIEKQINDKAKIQDNYVELLNNNTYINLPQKITAIINQLTFKERKYFRLLCDYKIFGKTTGSIIDNSIIYKLVDLGFIENYDNEDHTFKLTYLGEILYEYITKEEWSKAI